MRKAVASGRYYWKVFVGTPVNGTMLEGSVDLLVEEQDGLNIWAYWAAVLGTDEDLAAARMRYGLHGCTYALALQSGPRGYVSGGPCWSSCGPTRRWFSRTWRP